MLALHALVSLSDRKVLRAGAVDTDVDDTSPENCASNHTVVRLRATECFDLGAKSSARVA
jgi:hypothetical protein